MTITTFTILNGVLALGLLAGVAVVMLAGHRAAGSERAGSGHWTEPLRFDDSPLVESELERAA
jgi:hypothetical protein